MTVDLRHGDCFAVMDKIPDGSVDALMTDPPWGQDYFYRGQKEGTQALKRHTVEKAKHTGQRASGEREATKSPEAYWEWLKPKYEKAVDKVAPGGLIAVWQPAMYLRYAWDWFGKDVHPVICHVNFALSWPQSKFTWSWVPVACFWKPGAKPNLPDKRGKKEDFIESDMVRDIRTKSYHPLPRPLNEAKTFIERFVPDRGTILDPFMGSGTFGVAATLTGRDYIGIEVRKDYYEAAKARITTGKKTSDGKPSRTFLTRGD